MNKKLMAFLELIRLPGLFTAHADILAAFIIIGHPADRIPGLIWLILASSCFLSAGMALNDFFDTDIDARERPNRPIPSGRVRRSSALAIGLGLLAFGIFSAFWAGFRPFMISIALTAVILLYDGLLKSHWFFGPLTMASCRYFNLLMGLSLAPVIGWFWIPIIPLVYIFGVTVLSQKEAQGGKATVHIISCTIAVGSIPFVYCLFYLFGIFPRVSGLILVLILSIVIAGRVLKLLNNHSPEDYQGTIKKMLISIILFDALLAAGTAPIWTAGLILLLFFPVRWSAGLFKMT